ncbi:MAG: ABC transporter permease [Candidatus Eremiobacteraeota bacterium]|nr:ABC transporter permease [Candidatus Eremiobacteraeota bacterium]
MTRSAPLPHKRLRWGTSAQRNGLGVAVVVVLLALWELVARARSNIYLPPPSTILATFAHEWFSAQFRDQALPSLYRMAAGYAAASAIGIVLGVLIGAYRQLFRLLDPFLQFLRAIPPSAIIPVGILLIGIGDAMKIVVICFGALWPILVNAADGARNVPRERLDTARNFGVGAFDQLVSVTFPSALPGIFAGLRTGLSIAFIMIVVSEMIGSTNGLGYYILQSQRTFAIPEMYGGIVLLAILGYGFNAAFLALEHRVLGWHHGQAARPA